VRPDQLDTSVTQRHAQGHNRAEVVPSPACDRFETDLIVGASPEAVTLVRSIASAGTVRLAGRAFKRSSPSHYLHQPRPRDGMDLDLRLCDEVASA